MTIITLISLISCWEDKKDTAEAKAVAEVPTEQPVEQPEEETQDTSSSVDTADTAQAE